MQIKCVLVDDEFLALNLLEIYLEQILGMQIMQKFKSPILALEFIQQEPVDLLFLDIQMPVLSGINLLKTSPKKILTILTTAYPQHALEAYDLDVVDYLVKPFSSERLQQAIVKVRPLLESIKLGIDPQLENNLIVKADRKWVKLPFNDILLIEGWKEYVKIYTHDNKIITLESLNNLEKTLPEAHFLRVHKSFIIAIAHVNKLDGEFLILGTHKVPVARARKKQVIDLLFK